MAIEIIWVPGHVNVEGNEKADEAAKEAARSEGNGMIARSIHQPLKSARSLCILKEIMEEWEESWQSQAPNRDSKLLRRITKDPNIPRGKKLYNNIALSKHHTALLSRLHTGHCSLNVYLHRFGHAESPLCECNNGAIETVEHFLLHCPRFDKQRMQLVREVGVCGMRIEMLLGHRVMIRHTLKYVDGTRRLHF
jgi:hypothetical protein